MIHSLALRAATVCAVLSLAAPSLAQDDAAPDAAASALFREGRDLIKRGNWEAGCPKLAISMKRYPAPSTLLNLALCREHEGRVATAWAMPRRARVLNRETVGKTRRESLDAVAEQLTGRLQPRLPRLRVTIVPAVPNVTLTEDGRELPLDTAVPFDPGPHQLVATAAGHRDVLRTVTLREGETLAGELSLPIADDGTTVVPAPPPVPPTNPSSQPPTQPPGPTNPAVDEQGIPVWVWISGGAGIVLGGVAIAFAADAVNAASMLEERCGADLICDEDLSFDPEPLNDRKNRGTALAIGLGAGGVAGVVAAVVGLATSGGDDDAPPVVSGWATPNGAGLSLAGQF